jgi:UDP-N-acetylmuramyl pentapeptide phosphotransferase/UDP-N-acetylglucosamine-1-phosphate transferase
VALLATAILGAAVGFLVWNWAPARIFMGDVGSVPLGYLLGFLLLGIASRGWWKIALILPLYFLADATITLIRRLWRGEPVWRPHREHFYQQAVQRIGSHAAVVWLIVGANLLLIGLGWMAENGAGFAALASAVVVVLVLLQMLARAPRLI